MQCSSKKAVNSRSKNYGSAGITVVTCTRRPDAMHNIFENYLRQELKRKELIIILHNNSIDKNRWRDVARRYSNVRVLQISEEKSLGECLNIGARYAAYGIVAKFDDDDYYGPKYLSEVYWTFRTVKADVVGKATTYVYFEKDKILAIRNQGRENCYVQFVDGPTIVFKKRVLNKVRFRNISLGEDYWFCHDCVKHGIKIYSTSRFQHVYMRHANASEHTWSIDNKQLMAWWCKFVAKGKIDYSKYVNPKES